jgi:hypothetical protein
MQVILISHIYIVPAPRERESFYRSPCLPLVSSGASSTPAAQANVASDVTCRTRRASKRRSARERRDTTSPTTSLLPAITLPAS